MVGCQREVPISSAGRVDSMFVEPVRVRGFPDGRQLLQPVHTSP